MKVDEQVWSFFQQHLGYTDDEMKKFREDPRNEDVISKGAALVNKTIVAEVMESHGCNTAHKVGDKFYFDGAGNLISKLCPKKMCIFAVSALRPAVFAVSELFYAGVDPNEMRFRRTGCFDVGLQCGGWGRIVMEVRVEDRSKE